MRRSGILVAGLLVAGALSAALAACGGKSTGGSAAPGLVGLVYGYDDAPARDQPVAFVEPGGPSGTVGPDGRFFFSNVTVGSHLLRVGDSKTTPTFFVPVTVASAPAFLDRPLFLPSLESGVTETVTGGFGTAQVISGSQLDGVALLIGSSTSVTFPAGAPQQLTIVGVSPSRLPVALPKGIATRAAYAIEPRGARFGPSAVLTLPRLDASADPLELYRLDDGGVWRSAGAITAVTTESITATIDEASLYAIGPRTPVATGTLTGRIVNGGRFIEGYRIECWNQVSAPTKSDGRFTIEEVPTSFFRGFILRAFPARPGVDFAPEVPTALSLRGLSTDLGDVTVSAPPPIAVKPKVLSTSPADDAVNVSLFTTVSVQFSNAVDPKSVFFSVRGLRGPAAGQIFLGNPFTAVFVPSQPLDPADSYSIVVSDGITDSAGNRIDRDELLFKFTTQAVTAPSPPSDQKIFGMSPLAGSSSTLVTLFGRNFAGGSVVTVGGGRALVRQETATTIQFLPPTAEPASLANVAVTNSAQTNVSSLSPLTFDLRSSVASLSSGTILQSSPPAILYAVGDNVSRGTLLVDGVAIAAVDSTEPVGSQNVVVSLGATVGAARAGVLFTGPVVVRGTHGRPGAGYRFLHVADR